MHILSPGTIEKGRDGAEWGGGDLINNLESTVSFYFLRKKIYLALGLISDSYCNCGNLSQASSYTRV